MTAPPHALPVFAARAAFPTLNRVRTPNSARWLTRILLVLFTAAPFVLLFVPWQQTVRGRGQIIAYSPTERRQSVRALVSGRVVMWHVVEGTRVKVGDPIADIDDNDAGLTERLEEQLQFMVNRRKAAVVEINELNSVVAGQEKARDAAVEAAKANRDAAEKMVEVAQEGLNNAKFGETFEGMRSDMFGRLVNDQTYGGLVSRLIADEARMRSDRQKTDVKRAEAEIERARAAVLSAVANIAKADADGTAAIALARGNLQKAEQSLLEIDRGLQDQNNRIERFRARFVKSPAAGIVFRIPQDVQMGQFVKEGDELALIVPDTTDRVVELFINGVDAPLIAAHTEKTGRGPHVRLQFEGWPAVQFTGWPSVATGTFGGRVRQVDPADDGYGRFRILVEPESLYDEDQWPDEMFLRQGNQAVGWVFLNRVTVGFELWRQFNGFPPVVAPEPPDKSKDDAAKPPKIKVS